MVRITLLQKIKKLEEVTKQSIGFQKYTHGWHVTSFADNTPFDTTGDKETGFIDHTLTAKTFKEAVDQAYERITK